MLSKFVNMFGNVFCWHVTYIFTCTHMHVPVVFDASAVDVCIYTSMNAPAPHWGKKSWTLGCQAIETQWWWIPSLYVESACMPRQRDISKLRVKMRLGRQCGCGISYSQVAWIYVLYLTRSFWRLEIVGALSPRVTSFHVLYLTCAFSQWDYIRCSCTSFHVNPKLVYMGLRMKCCWNLKCWDRSSTLARCAAYESLDTQYFGVLVVQC